LEYDRLRYTLTPRRKDIESPVASHPFRSEGDGSAVLLAQVHEVIGRTFGAISDRTRHVVEIGSGSGRYLEKVLGLCGPERYQIYETASDWADYVVGAYGVTRCPTDGRKLGATETDSVDLIQAFKVMSGTTFLTTARYWVEMARVTRVGGYAVFDIVTEECLDPDTIERWAVSDLETGSYPAVIPRCVALDFFAGKGFRLAGSFFVPMGLGTTETFVFERTTPVRGDSKAAA
jgi:hypothetical protein